jgi:glycine/serine hydroxymethyltransferase
MKRIAELIDRVLGAPEDQDVLNTVRAEVRELAGAFPLYPVPATAGR